MLSPKYLCGSNVLLTCIYSGQFHQAGMTLGIDLLIVGGIGTVINVLLLITAASGSEGWPSLEYRVANPLAILIGYAFGGLLGVTSGMGYMSMAAYSFFIAGMLQILLNVFYTVYCVNKYANARRERLEESMRPRRLRLRQG